MKVHVNIVPIFRANAFADTYRMRQSVGDQFSQAYLIIPEGMDIGGSGFEIDLEKDIPENLVHIVIGSDGVPHVEPYLPAVDGITQYLRGPFQTYIRITGCKSTGEGKCVPREVFLELWDDLPAGLERPSLRAGIKNEVTERALIRVSSDTI